MVDATIGQSIGGFATSRSANKLIGGSRQHRVKDAVIGAGDRPSEIDLSRGAWSAWGD